MPETDQPMPLARDKMACPRPEAAGRAHQTTRATQGPPPLVPTTPAPTEHDAPPPKIATPERPHPHRYNMASTFPKSYAHPVRHGRITLLPIDNRYGQAVQDRQDYEAAKQVQPRRLGRFSRVLVAIVLLILLFGGGWTEYVYLNQMRTSIYEVNIPSGGTEWEQQVTTPVQIVGVDAQGSLLDVRVGQRHQLVAFDARGVFQWKSFVSTDSFFLPTVATSRGTVLVALNDEVSTVNNGNAADMHLLSCYLLKRSTGQVIWQRTLVASLGEQRATLLGADDGLIYISITALVPTSTLSGGQVITTTSSSKTIAGNELVAIDEINGNIAWHMFSMSVSQKLVQDSGKLLVNRQLLFWQVAGRVYALDATSGRMQWQRLLPEDSIQVLLQEEAQMVETVGVLVVERSDIYHALDVTTGTERWALSNPGINAVAGQVAGGLAAVGNTLLFYGNGQIQAFDATNRQIRWSQKQLDEVLNVTISADGTLVYATVVDSIEGGSPTQVLVALDLRNGAVRWTFQPVEQGVFVHLGAEGIILRRSRLVTEICAPTLQHGCTAMNVYVLRADSGQVTWKYEGNAISDVYYSADGGTLVFQGKGSAWSDLIAHFRN